MRAVLHGVLVRRGVGLEKIAQSFGRITVMPPDTEPAIEAAIARGLADVRESKVTPHPAVARLVTAAPVVDEGALAERAVVWSAAARDDLVARVQGLAADDPQAAAAFAGAVDLTARALGQDACGAEGLAPHTYEKIVPGTPAVLAFELVTWAKAGEVIAILHLFDAPRDLGREGPLWP